MDTGMGVGLVTGQVTGPAVEIPAVIICIVHNATRHAPGPNLPPPTKGRQRNGLRTIGRTMFTPTGTATSAAKQTRDGSSEPTRVGNQKTGLPRPSSKGTGRPRPSSKGTGRPRPSSKETGRPRPSSKGRDPSRPNSLTAATRHGSRAIKEPAVIISPAAAAEVVAVEAVAVEAGVVVVGVAAANNL